MMMEDRSYGRLHVDDAPHDGPRRKRRWYRRILKRRARRDVDTSQSPETEDS